MALTQHIVAGSLFLLLLFVGGGELKGGTFSIVGNRLRHNNNNREPSRPYLAEALEQGMIK